MDLKDMIITVVYQSKNGMSPVEIVEAISQKYSVQTTSKQIMQIVDKNPQLLTQSQGRVKSPGLNAAPQD